MSPLELVDDRFEKLASELRASRPAASSVLLERVAALGGVEPAPPRWRIRLPSRRLALGLVGAALLASFVVAGVTGLNRSGKKRAVSGAVTPTQQAPLPVTENGSPPRALGLTAKEPVFGAARLAPNAGRLQRYVATLRLRVQDVDALSSATRRAMNLTRSLGGYVASVNYATRGGKRGGATLVLRVPVANIQTELGKLTGLGTILQQRTGILDVTHRADRQSRQIDKLEQELAEASPSEAPAIRQQLKTLRARHARLLRSAQLARIVLTLTTPAKQAAAAPSRFDRTLDDAGKVLLRELEILLYAAVVAGPLLLLGAAVMTGSRAQRRRSDRRLLERA